MPPFFIKTAVGFLAVAMLAAPAVAQAPQPLTLYVAANGNDAWSGKLPDPNAEGTDGPFATLARARDAIRELKAQGPLVAGGVEVLVRGGEYPLSQPFELTADDSGTAEAPVRYSAHPGEHVRLMGGIVVPDFQPVTDTAVLERLDEAVRPLVMQADLKALGITDFGPVDGGGMEVFFDDQPMTLSRWPNSDFVRIVDIVVQDGHQIHGNPGSKVGKFVYDGERPSRWAGEKDGWLHGYWFWDWSDQRQAIASIDPAQHILEVKEPYHGYGYRKGQWYYAFNMLTEIDAPGEWYVDREAGILYFYPPRPVAEGRTVVSILPTLVRMEGTSWVTLRGFTMEVVRGDAAVLKDGTDSSVVACTVRNCGSTGIVVAGGSRQSVIGCDLYQVGGGGISMSGGDRAALTPCSHNAENNHIRDYGRIYRMYRSGISMQGVGVRAAHNLIHSAPHMAIQFGGNDHVIEFNEIHHVCLESNDAGAIYAGRDWTMRGHQIRHNYFHDIDGFEHRGCVGVYLDDMFASAAIYGNVFYRVTRAAFIGGGRDNSVENNIFVECNPALHVDARALGWAAGHADGWLAEQKEKGTLCGMAYNQPPYSERYPQLVTILEGEPKAPEGNTIAHNISWGGKWDGIQDDARKYLTDMHDNLVDVNPRFIDPANLDFRLHADSPAFAFGFKPIPVEKIGLYEDPNRASWPVTR